MPRKQRLRRRSTGYTEAHRLQLRVRWDYFGDAFGDGPEAVVAMQKAWSEIGDEVLTEHITEKPGSRPWSWWMWSSPEPRNKAETQTEQLKRLSLLTDEEITVLKMEF